MHYNQHGVWQGGTMQIMVVGDYGSEICHA